MVPGRVRGGFKENSFPAGVVRDGKELPRALGESPSLRKKGAEEALPDQVWLTGEFLDLMVLEFFSNFFMEPQRGRDIPAGAVWDLELEFSAPGASQRPGKDKGRADRGSASPVCSVTRAQRLKCHCQGHPGHPGHSSRPCPDSQRRQNSLKPHGKYGINPPKSGQRKGTGKTMNTTSQTCSSTGQGHRKIPIPATPESG